MSGLHRLIAEIHEDGKITDAEVEVIREQVHRDGKLDLDDVQFLVNLLSDAREISPAFDELFFPVLKDAILSDGKIDRGEQFYLLKMLYSDGHVRESEKQFLEQLRRDACEVPPEFDQLLEEACKAPPTNWDVGGR
jgi:hypothetical protein